MSVVTSVRNAVSSDRAKKIIPIVAVAIVLLIAAFVVYVFAVTPSKQPYRDALTQYRNVYNANIAVINTGKALNANSATIQQFETNIKNSQTSLTNLKNENDALGKQAVLQSGKGAELYAAFSAKLQDYIAYNTNILASIEKVRPAIYSCTQDMTNITESQASVDAIHACITTLQQVDNVPDADYKALVSNFMSDYTKLADVTVSIIALPDPKGADSAQYQALTNQRTDILDDLNSVSTTFSKNLQAHQQEVDITASAKALDDYLNHKASIF